MIFDLGEPGNEMSLLVYGTRKHIKACGTISLVRAS